jgi:uncharacterized membrane protein HdeD (DUF308 family)
MMNLLSRNWGWILMRGVALVLFGVLTFLNPAISLATLVLLFAAFAMADGILSVASALVNRRDEPHWVGLLLGGLAGIAVGVITLLKPGITTLFLLGLIAAWAILTGLFEIATAIRLRKVITGEWLMVLAGVLAIVFGLLLIANPGSGALAVVLWIGAFAVVKGIVLIALSLRLRNWGQVHPTSQSPRMA